MSEPRLRQDIESSVDSESSRSRPDAVEHHTHRNAESVHHLVGKEMSDVPGYAEKKNAIWKTDDQPRRPTHRPPVTHEPVTPVQTVEPHAIRNEGISDKKLVENGASVGLFMGGTAALSTSLAAAEANLAAGSVSAAGLLLAAPLAGGTIGYFVGKKMKHPVVGAATGAAIGGAGMLTAINTLGGGALVGGLTAGGLALSVAPAAVGGVITYGLGELHNAVWSEPGKKRPGIVGTYLRGWVAPVTIPAGLLYKGGKKLLGRG